MRKPVLVSVVLPLAGVAAYLALMLVVPTGYRWMLFSENGLFELGTAIGFLAAGVAAIRLGRKSRGLVAGRYTAFYFLLAATFWFIALEELSYGQHLFGWSSPKWFQVHNGKAEINLHNLYDSGISSLLRDFANLGLPALWIVIPVVALYLRGDYSRSRWSYFVLPRRELVGLALVAQSITWLDAIASHAIGGMLLIRPGEVQEFFWAIGSLAYVIVLSKRVAALAGADADADRDVLSVNLAGQTTHAANFALTRTAA